MKKILAIICVAALALACVVGCSSVGTSSKSSGSNATSSATKYVGEWQVDSVQVGNVSVDISSVFTAFSLKLNPDSSYEFTCELSSSDQNPLTASEKNLSASGTPWKETATGVTCGSGDDALQLTANGDKLVWNIYEMVKVNLVKKQ